MTNRHSQRRTTTRSNLQSARRQRTPGRRQSVRPASAHQHRGDGLAIGRAFDAPELWHEPVASKPTETQSSLKVVVQPAGEGYIHPVSADDVRERVLQLPPQFQEKLQVVQFSRMTQKRRLFPCYGLQWGNAVYLYPIEASLEELYVRAPRPAQRIESEMYGGRWVQDGNLWRLIWTENTIRDFYLNNVLITRSGTSTMTETPASGSVNSLPTGSPSNTASAPPAAKSGHSLQTVGSKRCITLCQRRFNRIVLIVNFPGIRPGRIRFVEDSL